ncbi:hypothetical protein K0M31_006704 [Melipona bicolor]|uniref:Uncharacterized protein n=1 Tax=Melipona bicolor TaxID=60889 RepID=A0AA40KL14_9HYME|nr:hypothetical protein K0M31_006704 [Melipona bicolor]
MYPHLRRKFTNSKCLFWRRTTHFETDTQARFLEYATCREVPDAMAFYLSGLCPTLRGRIRIWNVSLRVRLLNKGLLSWHQEVMQTHSLYIKDQSPSTRHTVYHKPSVSQFESRRGDIAPISQTHVTIVEYTS